MNCTPKCNIDTKKNGGLENAPQIYGYFTLNFGYLCEKNSGGGQSCKWQRPSRRFFLNLLGATCFIVIVSCGDTFHILPF